MTDVPGAGTDSGAPLAVVESFPDVLTGEVLPATPENAARALEAARAVKRQMDDVIYAVTEYVLAESRTAGTKTIATPAGKLTLTGGAQVVYEGQELSEALRAAGCPEDRVDAAVQAEVRYKVNQRVLAQLASANPAYAAAIRLVERTEPKPYRVSVGRGS